MDFHRVQVWSSIAESSRTRSNRLTFRLLAYRSSKGSASDKVMDCSVTRQR